MDRTTNVNALPELTVVAALQTGVAAVKADPALLDSILATLNAGDLEKAKAYVADHPPSVVLGYPRSNARFPLYAVTLGSDDTLADYVGIGGEAMLDDDVVTGNLFGRRLTGSFVIYVYAEHPDVCVWYYRLARRILGVATQWLIDRDLTEPRLSGAELAPDPRTVPEDIFVRRLTLTVEYEEGWDDTDALFAAFYPSGSPYVETRLQPSGELVIRHEDVGGGVHPVSADEE